MKLKGELEAVELLNRPEVVAAGFWPNVLGAFPVLPPNSGVVVPEAGLDEEAKIDGCCVLFVFEIVPPPKILVAGCDVDVEGKEKGEDVDGVEPAPNRPLVVFEGGFDEDPNNGLDGPPFPFPLLPPKLNDMINVVDGDD